MTIAQQIEQTRRWLATAKPRSLMRLRLEFKLKELMLRQLKKENRAA